MFPELAELLDALLEGLTALSNGDQQAAQKCVTRAHTARAKLIHMAPLSHPVQEP